MHGGNIWAAAKRIGCSPREILDFSASINPLGPPEWVGRMMGENLWQIAHYPDPHNQELKQNASVFYGVAPEEIVVGNGASEILSVIPRVFPARQAVIPVPSYVEYERIANTYGLGIKYIFLKEENNFQLDLQELEQSLKEPALVFLGQPNNPTGQTIPAQKLASLAQNHPQSFFIIDEAFADFTPSISRMFLFALPNVITIISLTKFFALPGLRIGLAIARKPLARKIENFLPPWSVNFLAQKIAAAALNDQNYVCQTHKTLPQFKEKFISALKELPELTIFPGQANFILVKLNKKNLTSTYLAEKLLPQKILIRTCTNFKGLGSKFFRLAIKTPEQNQTLVKSLRTILSGFSSSQALIFPTSNLPNFPTSQRIRHQKRKAKAIMVQGTSSNAGKSILAAALGRIFLQDGFKVAPFKAQNMSLNSFVTREGLEMGRAQVVQAQACRLDPDVRMNPVLLKPNSETGSQIIVLGKPVGNMNVNEYIRFKPKAFRAAQNAFDQLASEFEIIILEGAGSPAEINLKSHDIVNMSMARYAEAKVLLVGDIDRGGIFASFVGTLALLEKWEQDLICGLVINKFRGQKDLLKHALDFCSLSTGKPFLGIVPYIDRLGLPEEDSVSFKDNFSLSRQGGTKSADKVVIGVMDLPHISNFNDIDPLYLEPDAEVVILKSATDIKQMDALILPGSKNVFADLKFLQDKGFVQAILDFSLDEKKELVGICGGFQMLGTKIKDPHKIESDKPEIPGLNLLPIITVLSPEKTLSQVQGVWQENKIPIKGYEIHHGKSHPLANLNPVIISNEQKPLGYGLKNRNIWGTYVHGIFDSDAFRRFWLDTLREHKGLAPLKHIQSHYDLEPALDRLADIVRQNLDLDKIYALVGA